MKALAEDLQRAASSIVEAVDQLADRTADNREGWKDSNAQHSVTQRAISAFRIEVLAGFEALHRRLDAIDRHLGLNGTGGDHA